MSNDRAELLSHLKRYAVQYAKTIVPIEEGDLVACVSCDGKGYVSSGGMTPVPLVCLPCGGKGIQRVDGVSE